MPLLKINPGKLTEAVKGFLDEYGDEAVHANEEAVRKVAKQVTKELKNAGDFDDRTGKFRHDIHNEVLAKRGLVVANIGAGREGRKTHLLEFGHAKQNGGRTTAFNFVAPINDKVEEMYIRAMEELLGK